MKNLKTPIKAFLLSLTLSITVFLLVVYGIYHLNEKYKEQDAFNTEALYLIGQIVYLDEVLTMSTTLASETGELDWKERYEVHVVELDETFKKILAISPEHVIGDFQRIMHLTNFELVGFEKDAFEAIQSGNLKKAQGLLKSQDYLNAKETYSHTVKNLIKRLYKHISNAQKNNEKVSHYIFILSIVGFVMISAGWTRTITLQKKASKENREIYETLDATVEQRTSELRVFSQAVEQSPASITITDLEGNIEYVNPKFLLTSGYTLKEIKGKNMKLQISRPNIFQKFHL